jgi:hypothetical protein
MNAIRPVRLIAGLTGLAIVASPWPAAFAQSDTKSPTRAEVKEETRAANKSRELMPAGEGSPPVAKKPAPSTKTREERKAETMQARKEGQLQPGGQATYKASISQSSAKSTKARTDVKAETVQAGKEGKLMPAGEVIDPARK